MGRNKHEIWAFFSEKTNDDGSPRAECDQCGHNMVPLVARMKVHHQHCSRAHSTPTLSQSTETYSTPDTTEPPAKALRQGTLGFGSTSSSMQHQLDLQFTRYIISSNTPFLQAENRQLGKLFDMLRPGSKVPSRKRVAGQLLEEVYAEEKQKVVKLLKDANVTLALDGWSTLQNEPIIGVSISVNGSCYLVNTIDTSGKSHDSDYLTELLKEEKLKVEKEFEVHVTSIVTDNAANMASMRRQITSEESVILHCYGCNAHIGNLLAKDIISAAEYKAPIGKIVQVLKHFRNRHQESGQLKEKNVPRPPLPIETRWNSVCESLEYFITHWSDLACIVNSNLKPSENVYKYMEDILLKRAATDMVEVLKPIKNAINNFQREDCNLAECFEIWNDMRGQFPTQFQSHLTKRADLAVQDCMLAANVLDHGFGGKNLMPIELTRAKAFIKGLDASVTAELTQYLAKEPPYCEDLFDETQQDVRPAAWWKCGQRLGFDSKLIAVSLPLVTATGASAGIERQFSTLGMTYGKLRNQLGHEKAAKLAFMYRQLNKK